MTQREVKRIRVGEFGVGIIGILELMKEIAVYCIMSNPALLINGKIPAKGNVPPEDKIKRWLMEARV